MQIGVRLLNETVWLTQVQMAELFQKDRTFIIRHINNVFREGEREREQVSAKLHIPLTRHGVIEGNLRVQESCIGHKYQTFGEEELYPSVEEKAVILLYLVTMNYSFSDGNKSNAATLFLWFINNNYVLYREMAQSVWQTIP